MFNGNLLKFKVPCDSSASRDRERGKMAQGGEANESFEKIFGEKKNFMPSEKDPIGINVNLVKIRNMLMLALVYQVDWSKFYFSPIRLGRFSRILTTVRTRIPRAVSLHCSIQKLLENFFRLPPNRYIFSRSFTAFANFSSRPTRRLSSEVVVPFAPLSPTWFLCSPTTSARPVHIPTLLVSHRRSLLPDKTPLKVRPAPVRLEAIDAQTDLFVLSRLCAFF